MDLWQLIRNDHADVDAQFKRILGATGGGATSRDKLFSQLKADLEMHAKVEEDIFYPALEKHAETRDMARHAREEHGEVKQMLNELSSGDKGGAEWTQKLQELQSNVQHHVQEEENNIIPKAQRVIDAEQANELMRRIEREKAAELQGASS